MTILEKIEIIRREKRLERIKRKLIELDKRAIILKGDK